MAEARRLVVAGLYSRQEYLVGKRLLPNWIKGSAHAWRMKKRRELVLARKAVNKLRKGSAYTPAYDHIVQAYDALEKAAEKMSVKRWGK